MGITSRRPTCAVTPSSRSCTDISRVPDFACEVVEDDEPPPLPPPALQPLVPPPEPPPPLPPPALPISHASMPLVLPSLTESGP